MAAPRLRSHWRAPSILPLLSSSARLQSMTGAPVSSRSCLILLVSTATIHLSPRRSGARRPAGRVSAPASLFLNPLCSHWAAALALGRWPAPQDVVVVGA